MYPFIFSKLEAFAFLSDTFSYIIKEKSVLPAPDCFPLKKSTDMYVYLVPLVYSLFSSLTPDGHININELHLLGFMLFFFFCFFFFFVWMCVFFLRHYENTPIQIYRKLYLKKTLKIFR